MEERRKLFALPYKDLKPSGWLLDQMTLQMDGITRDLDQVWGSVSNHSDWIGGTNNSWERPPYWLDGLVPLSYLLDDQTGIDKSKKWLEWSLNSQRANGDFGPNYRKTDFDETLFWPKFVMLKSFVSYYESTEDVRVISLMTNYFKFVLDKLDTYKMSGWGQARGADLTYTVMWLYDITKDEFLMDLAKKINDQSLNWVDTFESFPFVQPTAYYYPWEKTLENTFRGALYDVMKYHLTHVVNVAMGFKQPAMKYLETGNEEVLKSFYKGIEALEKYHGQITGMFSGDEHLSGDNPTQGTELCAVVEMMFSLQIMLEVTGDPKIADLLERITYNALPATISEDFKTHQYDQQVNQVLVSVAERNWYNNEPDSNVFGFEPNFGCCLANMHQGWPKFIKSGLFKKENNIYAMVHMPLKAEFDIDGQAVHLDVITDYPFREKIVYKVHTTEATKFQMMIRIPSWCDDYRLKINNKVLKTEDRDFIKIDRVFCDGDTIEVKFVMEVKKHTGWYHNGMTVERGPLIYALQIDEEWIERPEGIKSHPNYEIYPHSPWNYALVDDEAFKVYEKKLEKQPFGSTCPVQIKTNAKRVSSWFLEKSQAGDLPLSPVDIEADLEEITLIPYANAKLRIGLFPWSQS
ncbi:hypothetical protein EZV73_21355 [Acidaminobacter sp. JC074]|uniref:beta-L-arabinofuranosidase domain-containing protein n=1 Tax=Acidaminobacter sp. JC074 TaxID=2530199 RepID=UPI001F0E9A53|nr:beta-L-arabinofuranosidase domain-containing protein [Acidaminobacter sp. JC074]MCH4890142.1 hypothetical protein [Acidaminobacter sp. JC074]